MLTVTVALYGLHVTIQRKVREQTDFLATRIRDKLIPAQSPHQGETLRQYPSVILVIDTKGEDGVNFHFQLENHGDTNINVLQVTRRTDSSIVSDGNLPFPRLVPPHEKLQWNGYFDKKDAGGVIALIVVYEPEAKGVRSTFTSKYQFPVRLIDLYPHTIYPSSREELEGRAPDGDNLLNTFPSALLQPTGTVEFWCPERRPDGQINFLLIAAAPDRRIYFDPLNGFVQFMMTSKGRLYNLKKPFREPKSGLHFVAATWDGAGNVHLYVDGSK